ncbi:MAG: universal stress protein [Anaerolineales bacterium]|nr:universal stress protein [Anaerolineales bacterium]
MCERCGEHRGSDRTRRCRRGHDLVCYPADRSGLSQRAQCAKTCGKPSGDGYAARAQPKERVGNCAGSGLESEHQSATGDIIEEIVDEIEEGAYDLICMGSAYSADTLRQFYAPNIAAEVAEAARRPVLTARFTGRRS